MPVTAQRCRHPVQKMEPSAAVVVSPKATERILPLWQAATYATIACNEKPTHIHHPAPPCPPTQPPSPDRTELCGLGGGDGRAEYRRTKMLIPIAEAYKAVFPKADRKTIALEVMLAHWDALDMETGAHLSSSRGRSSRGRAHMWILIMPDVPPEGAALLKHSPWSKRSKFRAWTLAEAIETGNKRLSSWLKTPHAPSPS